MIQSFTKKHRGFTLVELLVVIAIIGLLSTIVLVSFGPIRTQARDTAIKANMSQIRLAAEIEYAANASYSGTTSRQDYIAAKAAAEAALGTSLVVAFSASAYCVLATPLPGTGFWCIDSIGYVGGAAGYNDCVAGSDYTCKTD